MKRRSARPEVWHEPSGGRRLLRSLLTSGLVATVLLPVVIAVLAGLAGLLRALDDGGGALACAWTALVAGAVWGVAVVVTVMASAAAILAEDDSAGSEAQRRRRRRRRPARLIDGA